MRAPSLRRRLLMGILLPVVAFITLRTRKWPDETAPLDPWLRRLIIWGSAFVIGGYDGYYGPGTGTFMMIALVRFAKLDTRHAAGGVKVVNLASNLGSLFTALRAGPRAWARARRWKQREAGIDAEGHSAFSIRHSAFPIPYTLSPTLHR